VRREGGREGGGEGGGTPGQPNPSAMRRRKGSPRMHTLVTEELRENFGEEGGREGGRVAEV